MPVTPDFRARTLAMLDELRDDDTAIVATTGPDGHLLMQARNPTPRALTAIARSLLAQASDDLDQVSIAEPDADLLASIDEALAALPDPEDTDGEVPV